MASFFLGVMVASCWARGRGIEKHEKEVTEIETEQPETENETEIRKKKNENTPEPPETEVLESEKHVENDEDDQYVWYLLERSRVAHRDPNCRFVKGSGERLQKRKLCKICAKKCK